MPGPSRKESVLAVQGRVIFALMLRDLRTRFFGHGLGYLIAMLWPITHMTVLLTIYIYSGRTTPLGTSLLQYLAVAVVPGICFMYMSRYIMFSVNMNKPLLNFPIVRLVDVILARAILEAAGACCVAALVSLVLFGIGIPVAPHDPVQAALGFLSTMLLGLGFGSFNGVMVSRLPGWGIFSVIMTIVLYLTSGVLFLPNALPEVARDVVAWNPLLHCVEWIRQAYYIGFTSLVLAKWYPIVVGLAFFFLALTLERGMRRFG